MNRAMFWTLVGEGILNQCGRNVGEASVQMDY
jgi:hypothetical protein